MKLAFSGVFRPEFRRHVRASIAQVTLSLLGAMAASSCGSDNGEEPAEDAATVADAPPPSARDALDPERFREAAHCPDCDVLHSARLNLPLTGVAAASAKMHAPDGRFFEVTLRDSGEVADEKALFADERQTLKLRYGKLQPELHAWTETAGAADRAWVWVWASVKTTFVAREELLASESAAKAHDEQVHKDLDAALAPIREWLTKNAPDAERGDASGPMLRARLSRSEVKALAELPQVDTLGTDSYPGKPTSSPWSATSQWAPTLRLDWAHAVSTGAGSKVCVKEAGRPDDLTKLVIAATANPSGPTDPHVRGMAGIVRNTDVTSAPWRCAAPSAAVYIANWYGFAGTGGVDEWCRTNATPIINYAWEVSSSTTTLQATDWAHDWLAKNSPYIVVVATAGVADVNGYVQNRGFSGLVVGAIDDRNTADRSDDIAVVTSAWRNPSTAHGDHELPHVVAVGNGSSVTGAEFSGTSAATAMTSGVAALLTAGDFSGWPEMRRAVMLATSTGRADQGLLTTLSGAGDMRIGAGEVDAFQAADLGTGAFNAPANAVLSKGRTAFTANFTSSFGADGYLTTKWKAHADFSGRIRVALVWDSTATCPSGTSGACTGDTSDGDFDLHLFKKTDGTWTTTGEMPCSSSTWDSTWEMCDISVNAGEDYLIGVRKYGTSGSSTYMAVAWYNYKQGTGQPCVSGSECSVGTCTAGRCGCNADYQCPDRFCDASGQCATRFSNGTACARVEQCLSGNCADGVCCNTACIGTCYSCVASKNGAVTGTCSAIPANTNPDNECAPQSCSGGTVTRAEVCSGSGSCMSAGTYSCGGLVCAGTGCRTTCAADADCIAGYYCSGTSCLAKKANGVACTATNQCTSGFCVDGVCCDSLCNGSCQACTATKRGTGASGSCGYIVSGSDPDVECTAQSCSGGTVTRAYACNGSGTCTSMGTYSCSGYVCSGTGCRTTCAVDADCTSGYYCSGTSCVAKKANGLACSATNQCASGFCTDGVCCDSLCNGSCQACSATKKGSGIDGTCGYVVSGSDPDVECAAQTCTGSTVTRAYACNGAGTCTSMGTYSCGAYTCGGAGCRNFCTADGDCSAGYYCAAGACVAKNTNGLACTATNQCASGFCTDGVCCDSLCDGTCQACSVARKGSGVDGTCGPTADGGSALGLCAGVTCVDGVVNAPQVCNGSGGCRASTSTSCGGFGCSGSACATTCGPSTPCASTHYCLGGSCVLKLVNGAACASTAECASGNCVDGVCCNTACGAACQACNVTGAVGTCTATDEAGCAPICGSGVRNAAEECDDGLGTSTSVRRACSSTCIVQDLPVAPSNSTSPARTLGTGRHPIAVAANGHAVVYIEDASSTARVALATFDSKGVAQDPPKVVASSGPLAANPVVAALPDGKFVVAYTSIGGDGDSLGVVLRKVDPIAGPLGSEIVANGTTAFSQYDADMLWTGTELVVAWVDTSSFTAGADLKFRRFNSSLAPLAAEETLANTAASESDVALAPFGTSWAAAWRSASGGAEQIMVRAAGKTWSAAVTMPGPAGVRPTLVELDSTHLLVVFVEQGLDTTTGEITPNQLRGAIVDTTTTAGPLTVFAIGASPSTTPVLTRVGSRTYFAWNREAAVGDKDADELWLQELTWTGTAVDFTATPMLLPRAAEHRVGDQRWPALAGTSALITAWEDYGKSLGVPRTTVVTQWVPLPLFRSSP